MPSPSEERNWSQKGLHRVDLWQKAKACYWGHELWDQTTLWNLPTIKTEENEVHMPTANDLEHVSTLLTFKFSAKIIHTTGTLTTGDFHQERSGGHVVPTWKSSEIMVDCEFGCKWPDSMVSVSSGENQPTLWLVWVWVKITSRYEYWIVWVWGKNHPTLWLECVLCFPVDAMTLQKLIKLH